MVEGADGAVPPLMEVSGFRMCDEIFMLPSHWCRGDGVVISYLGWYSSRYYLSMEAGAVEAWCAVGRALTVRMLRRGVRLYVFRDDCVSSEFADYFWSVSCLCGRETKCWK